MENKYEFLIENTKHLTNNILLNETFYLKNNKQLNKIDSFFQDLLDMSTIENGILEVKRAEAEKIIKNISLEIKKILNINLKLVIDYERNEPVNLAYTIPTKNSVKKVIADIESILVSKEKGYSFIKLSNVYVYLENAALKLFSIYNNDIDKYNRDLPKVYGRNLTAILLHEIGHNIFISYSYQPKENKFILSDRQSFSKGEPFILDIEKDTLRKEQLSLIAGILLSGITLFSSLIVSSLYITASKYLREEKYANTFPIQYGYAEEVYENAVIINKTFNQKNFKDKILDKINWNFRGYQFYIKKGIIRVLQDEANDPNNSPKQVAYALSLIDELKNIKNVHTKDWL